MATHHVFYRLRIKCRKDSRENLASNFYILYGHFLHHLPPPPLPPRLPPPPPRPPPYRLYPRFLPPNPELYASSCNFGLTTCLASVKTPTRSLALAELVGVKRVYAVP